MTDEYDQFFDYGPSIDQRITVEYTLVAAAAHSHEEFTGEIKEANDSRLAVKRDEQETLIKLVPKYGTLQVYANGGRLGPVQSITEQ